MSRYVKSRRHQGVWLDTRARNQPVISFEDKPDPANGDRRQKMLRRNPATNKRFASEKEAAETRRRLLTEIEKGTYIASSTLTLGEYLRRWLPSLRTQVRPSTWESYRGYVEGQIIPRLGGIKLQALKPTDLNGLYASLLEAGSRNDGKRGSLSARTVRYCHTLIKLALRDALNDGLVSSNVAARAKPPKQQREEMKTWTPDEVRAFLNKARQDRLFPAFALALSTGMRRGEILGLRKADLDLEVGTLRVEQTLITIGYKAQFSSPKTANGRRTLDLDGQTTAILKSHLARQAAERLSWGSAWIDSGLVFTKENGEPLHPDGFVNTFERLVREADLPKIRFHDLRHSYASIAIKEGMNILVLSRRLGHASPAFTLTVYGHLMPGQQREAAERIAQAIFGGAL